MGGRRVFRVCSDFHVIDVYGSYQGSYLVDVVGHPRSRFLVGVGGFMLQVAYRGVRAFLFMFSRVRKVGQANSMGFSTMFSSFLFVVALLQSIGRGVGWGLFLVGVSMWVRCRNFGSTHVRRRSIIRGSCQFRASLHVVS